MLLPVRPSVCHGALYVIARPSICLSHGCISQKQLTLGLWSFQHTVAGSLLSHADLCVSQASCCCVTVRGRRYSGESVDAVDSGKENEPMTVKVDPRIEKDIEELSKLRESGAASVILKDLQRKKTEEPVLDPRSASRTPSAAMEPPYRTRYESPIFACKFFIHCEWAKNIYLTVVISCCIFVAAMPALQS